ncbi:hypothetical protein [Parendozoicomonas haliclonae]
MSVDMGADVLLQLALERSQAGIINLVAAQLPLCEATRYSRADGEKKATQIV